MQLTLRGKRVVALVILIGMVLMYQLITKVWWVGFNSSQNDFLGYCFNTMLECDKGLK